MALEKHRINNRVRSRLKNPLGELLSGSEKEIIKQLKAYMKAKKPDKIFAVGDVTSEILEKYDINVNVYIVDNRVMRKAVHPISLKSERVIRVRNPPGTITHEAWEAIRKSTGLKPIIKIVVEGEEDLLTLPTIVFASNNSIVLYGQPQEGLVVVSTTEEKKKEVKSIINSMNNHTSKIDIKSV